jgi:hypothetical protein
MLSRCTSGIYGSGDHRSVMMYMDRLSRKLPPR